MKKTISFLLVFCLFAFSLFSTGCGSSGGSSSGGFKFHGAVVDIDVVAGLDGATNSARLSPNVRGAIAISARDTIVKVYELNPLDPELRGAAISDIKATFANNKLTCNTKENPLGVGDYLFEVYNSGKVFLRAILHVDGTSNKVSLEISPVTEIKTAVYKEWVAKAPAVTSITNFELNLTDLTPAQKTQMTEKAKTYAENLAIWNKTADIAGTVEVDDIDVPTETLVNNPIPGTTRPADLQNANWRTITADDIVGKGFGMRYILDTDTNTWIKFTNTDIYQLPNIMFTPAEYYYGLGSGYYNMVGHGYTEEIMDGWEPDENNEFEITQEDAIDECPRSIYKVLSDSKIEVIDFDIDNVTLLDDEKLIYDARITVYEGKTYLHIIDDQEIYELVSSQPQHQQPQQPSYRSVR